MENIVFENQSFALTVGTDCVVKSLINKKNGEECILPEIELPLFSATQDRPFNNEVKLAYMNKRTTFQANHLEREGDTLRVKFELVPFTAIIKVGITDSYMTFTLVDFEASTKDYPDTMEIPPVCEFNLCQLAVKKDYKWGQWINVCHTEESRVSVLATSPYALCDSQCLGKVRVMRARAMRDLKLRGCTAALVVSSPDCFLDVIEQIEIDYDLPRGVASRRSDLINASIYWTCDISPANIEEHIELCKRGGFRLMLLYYPGFFKTGGYDYYGDCDFKDTYPNGVEDVAEMVRKIRAAGILPGFHFLHTHIGLKSRYVTPVCDHRLNIKRHFTLSKPLSAEQSDVIYVNECPVGAPFAGNREKKYASGFAETQGSGCQVLMFGGELIFYSGFSTEYPYCFTGCKRGFHNTNIVSHPEGQIGGVLDVSEYGGGVSTYVDQNSDLQEEYAKKLAAVYDTGFEFIYFDGSEGANLPYEFHVPNAQYRVYKTMKKAPIFCEGAAKAHFGWHMLSGANAFDVFPNNIFKKMIIAHPFTEAEFMRYDYTRVNFGWWRFNATTSVDLFEFGTSKAASWDCPATMMSTLSVLRSNPRLDDVLEMMRRWEEARATKWLTEAQKEMLRDPDKEYTLLINENGEFEMVQCEAAPVGGGDERVTAYIFERHGYHYAQLWDNAGESSISFNNACIVSYSKELGKDNIAYPVAANVAELPVSGRAYLRVNCDKETLIEQLNAAKITVK